MTDAQLLAQISSLSPDLKKEVLDFVEFLKWKTRTKLNKRQPGCAKGLIEMAPDFDEPLEDFNEYM